MKRPLRVLIVDDSEDSALPLVDELSKAGYEVVFEQVDTRRAMSAALGRQTWDLVIAGYLLPQFSAPAALKLLKETGMDLPFIVVSGDVDEDTAAESMRAEVHDYVLKGDLTQLIPVVERELREAKERHEYQRAQNALLESEFRYRALFENASDAILVHDMDGNITMANGAMAKLTGYAIEELLNMNVSQLPLASDFQSAMEQQEGRPKSTDILVSGRYECQMIRKDGMERTIEFLTSLLTSEGKPSNIQAIVRDVTEVRRAQENVRIYAKLVTEAQEDERKRIARELHDETAQDLASLALDVDMMVTATKGLPADVLNRLERLRGRIDHILQGVRRFGQDLRPSVLEDFGLLVALQWLSDDLSSQFVPSSSVEVSGTPRRLSPHTELVLFRMAQEALNNVRKHAQATKAVVRVRFDSRKVTVSVTDNGHGFEMPDAIGDLARLGKLGIVGMQERANLINGRFSIDSEVGKGTTVTVEVTD